MITTINLATAPPNFIGKVLIGSDINIAAKYFMPMALRTGVAAPHAFVGLQGVTGWVGHWGQKKLILRHAELVSAPHLQGLHLACGNVL